MIRLENPGKYIYCIIRCPERRTFEEAEAIAHPKNTVHTISCDGIAAVVSDSMISEFENTRPYMIAHESVQEVVMNNFTLLPVRFGTVAGSDNPVKKIKKLLKKRGSEFKKLLDVMDGKVELGVKALWKDEKAIIEEVVDSSRKIRKLKSLLKKRPDYLATIRLGRMIKKSLEKKRKTEAERILRPMKRLAYRHVENPPVMDRMIINSSFLVEKKWENRFDGVLEKLDREYEDRISFRYFGPVPPYNFVNIIVNWEKL